jgi:hypothetical protein
MIKSKRKYKTYVLIMNDMQDSFEILNIYLKQDETDEYTFDIKYFYTSDIHLVESYAHELHIFTENLLRKLNIPKKYLAHVENDKERNDILLKIMLSSIFPIAMNQK